jgi:hypothetical protein
MKTRKFIVYVLISFFILSPFLNLEGWATSRTYPIKQPPTPELRTVCFLNGNNYCCMDLYCETPVDCELVNYFCMSNPTISYPEPIQ